MSDSPCFSDLLAYSSPYYHVHASFAAQKKRIHALLHFTPNGLFLRRATNTTCRRSTIICQDYIPYRNVEAISANQVVIPCFACSSLCAVVGLALAVSAMVLVPFPVVMISAPIFATVCTIPAVVQCCRSGTRTILTIRRTVYSRRRFDEQVEGDVDVEPHWKRVARTWWKIAKLLWAIFTFNPIARLIKRVLALVVWLVDARRMANPFVEEDEVEVVVRPEDVTAILAAFERYNCPLAHSELYAVAKED
uniref:Uncharacterized protein n=1 Tax=Sexangularia sp. CB-2014 TaxID=1486929 RepID=A0A7S1V943_9EUKA